MFPSVVKNKPGHVELNADTAWEQIRKVSQNDEFYIQNEEFCSKIEEFCI